ncbi:MAG: hypothetical protein ACWGON_10635 [Gemmatimonadota bacterium]
MSVNLYAAWICFLCGALAGATTGLFFHGEDWLGGYSRWRRRMVRLGHIAFFGIGLLNLAFVLSAESVGLTSGLELPSVLLILGAVTMPAVCYLSAYRDPFRNLFFIPAGAVTVAIAVFLWRLVTQ